MASQFTEQSLWYNSLIRINNNPIFQKQSYRKGIINVKHLTKEQRRKIPDSIRVSKKIQHQGPTLGILWNNFCTENAMENIQPRRPHKRRQWIRKLFDKTKKSQKSKQDGVN